jgi:hypothetical protein
MNCQGITKAQKPCGRRANGYCWQHKEQVYTLIIKSFGVDPLDEWRDISEILQSRIDQANTSWISSVKSLTESPTYRAYAAWYNDYVISFIEYIDDEDLSDDEFEFWYGIFKPKIHFAHANLNLIKDQLSKLTHQKCFRNHITQDLIAEAMHPRRMMARISQFDDFERFFECS